MLIVNLMSNTVLTYKNDTYVSAFFFYQSEADPRNMYYTISWLIIVTCAYTEVKPTVFDTDACVM